MGAQFYLFYDPSCPLCRRFKAWIEAGDRHGAIQALALDDPELPTRFPDLDLAQAQAQLTVRDQEGNLYRGLAALRQLSLCLPGLRHLDWIYLLPGVKGVAEGVYRLVNRYRKGWCLSCGERWLPSRKYSERKRRQRLVRRSRRA